MKKFRIALAVIFLVLICDQAIKIWIKTHMMLGEETGIFGLQWARIHFLENEGMAFGMVLGGSYGKLLLSLFRLVAIVFISIYLRSLIIQKNSSKGLIICISLILAGAIGNIIDSVFYGVLFNDSTHRVATLFPASGGYAPLLHGNVVDMFYFPLVQGTYPQWFPYIGGKYFLFFRPVFNFADSAITTGVLSILIFQREIFRNKKDVKEESIAEQN